MPPHITNKPWISRKNYDKDTILLWKTTEGNERLRVRVRVRVKFLLFCFKLAPTDPWCNMLRELTGTEKIWGGNVRWTPSYEWKQKILLFKQYFQRKCTELLSIVKLINHTFLEAIYVKHFRNSCLFLAKLWIKRFSKILRVEPIYKMNKHIITKEQAPFYQEFIRSFETLEYWVWLVAYVEFDWFRKNWHVYKCPNGFFQPRFEVCLKRWRELWKRTVSVVLLIFQQYSSNFRKFMLLLLSNLIVYVDLALAVHVWWHQNLFSNL